MGAEAPIRNNQRVSASSARVAVEEPYVGGGKCFAFSRRRTLWK
jgi:hypothetical protein